MEEKTSGRHHDFQDLPDGKVPCVVCEKIIPAGLMSKAIHHSECVGKENYEKMEKLGKLYQDNVINEEQFKQQAREIYGLKDDNDPRLAHIEGYLLQFKD